MGSSPAAAVVVRGQRSQLWKTSFIVLLGCICMAHAAHFDKEEAKLGAVPEDQHHFSHSGLQLSRDPAEQQHQREQDILAAALEGGARAAEEEREAEELERRLLLASLLDNDVIGNGHGQADNRVYYNVGAEDEDDSDDQSQYLMGAQEKRGSSPNSPVFVYRRGCIRRSGNCDHRPNDCCYSSSCRCNLWGSNCRCQRMGLFQKWG